MLGNRHRLLAGASFTIIAAAPIAAFAQTSNDTSGVGEIVVTAQKREQSIQDVPIAVSALGQATLQANRVASVSDITGLAPGLIARRNPGGLGSPQFTMRGISASPSVPAQDSEISMYLDGVYLGGVRGSVSDLPDLERIEVLRGPQGTLFGRNSTAGAIQFVTRDPTGEFSAQQDITVGNQDQFRSRTTINTPKFGPFSGYVTFVHDEKNGDVRNLGAGTTFDRTNPFSGIGVGTSPRYLGGHNNNNVFAALRFDNGGDVTVTYKFDWGLSHFVQDARVVPVINANDFIGGLFAQILAVQPVGGGAYGPVTVPSDFRRPDAYNNAWAQTGSQFVEGHNLTAEWKATDHLTIKNIFAYRKNRVYSASPVAGLDGLEYNAAAQAIYTGPAYPGGPSYATLLGGDASAPVGSYFAAYDGEQYGKFWQVSDEVQANYTSDRLNVTAGALYYESKELSSAFPGFRPNFTFTPVPYQVPLGGDLVSRSHNKSYAAYLQAEFSVTPTLQIVAGGRVTKDQKTPTFEYGGTFVGTRTNGQIVGATSLPSATYKKTKPTYSVGLNYKVTPDVLVYGKYSTAFLSGGAVANLTFQPETARSWEAGLKSEFLDHMVQLNVAAYSVVYKNAQAAISASALTPPRYDINLAVINNGEVKAKGVEVDLNVAPTRGLTFGGTMGYTHVELLDPDPRYSAGKTLVPTGVPKLVGSGYVSYVTQPLFDDATMLFRLDATYQSRNRIINDANIATNIPAFVPYAYVPAKTIVNGRIALQNVDMGGGGNLEVGVWSKNLFNNRMPLYPFQFGTFFMTTDYEQARTFGLDVIVKFKPS